VLSARYGIDNSEFTSFLNENKFVVNDGFLSEKSSTLASMAAVYSMGREVINIRGKSDVAEYDRALISGSGRNHVFKTFKENGYTTIQFLETDYFYSNKKDNLDKTDINVPAIRFWLGPFIDFTALPNVISKYIPSFSGSADTGGTLEERVVTAMSYGSALGKPYFIVLRSAKGLHTPNAGYSWKDLADWVHSGKYAKGIWDTNSEVVPVVKHIVENDPGSVIVLLGDHGSWGYRGLADGMDSYDGLASSLSVSGVSLRDFVDDKHAVFMAIRFPDGDDSVFSGKFLSSVNLFNQLFNWMAGEHVDDVESKIMFNKLVLIRDGKLVLN